MEESDCDLLTSYLNQSLMTASDGMNGIKAPEGLQPKGFESILHPFPRIRGCFILHEKDFVCFDECHPPNSYKRWLTDEIFSFSTLWT